ncbi:MAG: class I SAM-dependent methyltransferase [Chitinophagales bacterium]|nr:class I SAM-dependent methyltransferase [Chitinophagales bacterium]
MSASSPTALLDQKAKVPKEFNKIARRYDMATGLSQGYQEDLDRSAGFLNLKGDEYVLDLCCGTGKSTQAVLKFISAGHVVGVDNSETMLEVAKEKLQSQIAQGKLSFSLQDAMHLSYPEKSFDAIFMAYGLRNMPDYDACLRQLYTILKPGGRLVIHDYSLADHWFSKPYWWIMGNLFIVPISYLTTGEATIFRYLIKSVQQFLRPKELLARLEATGFKQVTSHAQPSWRRPILRTFVGVKP